jgi:hypothetical protein
VVVERARAKVKGLFPEQILTGPNFGLPTSVDPDTELYRDLYSRKLTGVALTAEEDAKLQELQNQGPQEITLGETEAQQIAYRFLMEAMEKRLSEVEPALRDQVRKEAALLLATERPLPPVPPDRPKDER